MSFDCVKGPAGGILELSDRVYPRGSYKCLLETVGIFLALHFVGNNIFQDGAENMPSRVYQSVRGVPEQPHSIDNFKGFLLTSFG